jgi:GT2 family glycosyltransferase
VTKPPRRIALPAPERPRASVVVVAWRNAPLLERCLAALARQTQTAVAFETVVVLNGALEAVVELVRDRVTGARVVESRVNLGFGGGANRAAASTSTEYLVFLNDDTEVSDGWLEPLVETADIHADAGAVGSRTLNPHGFLLEAGAVLWRNGSVWHVGRGLPGATARYRYLRRVDYSSGSSLLVRRATWETVGGFDRTYFPGYYEDVDLCLSIARMGQCVLYQPRSLVRHNESSSLDPRFKGFVAGRSRKRFCDKWQAELGRFLAEPEDIAAIAPDAERVDALPPVQAAILASRRLSRRALVVGGDFSGSGGVRDGIEALAAAGWAVTSTAGDPDDLGRLGVEVTDGDPASHLRRTPVLYDAVVLTGTDGTPEVLPVVRERQGLALVATAGAGVPSDHGFVDLGPDRPGTWPTALDAALRGRVGAAAPAVRRR